MNFILTITTQAFRKTDYYRNLFVSSFLTAYKIIKYIMFSINIIYFIILYTFMNTKYIYHKSCVGVQIV